MQAFVILNQTLLNHTLPKFYKTASSTTLFYYFYYFRVIWLLRALKECNPQTDRLIEIHYLGNQIAFHYITKNQVVNENSESVHSINLKLIKNG